MKRTIIIGAFVALLCGCGNRQAQTETAEVNSKETIDTVLVAEDNPEETMADSTDLEDEPIVEVLGDSTTVRYLKALPDGFNEDDLFGLILDYGGYAMDAAVWPMPDGDWLVTDHWCAEEGGCIFKLDENGNEYEVIYKDPFNGEPYPVIHKPDLSFGTRNYGGQTINFYAAPDSDEVLCSTNKEINLDAIAADLKTRRLLVRSNPNDWCWAKPGEKSKKEPFIDLQGWIDEEWVCGSTMTTCP